MILPIVYAGNIEYFTYAIQNKETVVFDEHEHFVKQSFRNRTEIYGANGRLSLIIPLEKRNKRTPMHMVKIAYEENWRKHHWKSLQSAYRSSPYFEFYEDEFAAFYAKKYEYLVAFNMDLFQLICSLLQVEINLAYTTEYFELEGLDYRKSIHPRNSRLLDVPEQKYIQVFDSKYGFIPNLTVLDLLFNEGPNAINYLK